MLKSHSPCRPSTIGRAIACSFALLSCVILRTSEASAPKDALAPVVVAALQGDVSASDDNHPVALKVGSTVPLPVIVKVAAGGSIELHQGHTVIRAAQNSRLELPRSHDAAETLDRVVQSSGNVLYNVAKRPLHKLQIGTPYLVAVIKGTQFNVSVQPDSVTLSLLEGRVEVRSSKSAEVVEMESGQMAISSDISPVIRLMNMKTGDILRSGRPQLSQVAAATTASASTALTIGVGSGGEPATSSAGAAASTAGTTTASAGLAEVGATTVITKSSGPTIAPEDDRGASAVLMLNGLLAHTSAVSSAAGTDTSEVGASTGSSTPTPTGFGTGAGGSTTGSTASTGSSTPAAGGSGSGTSVSTAGTGTSNGSTTTTGSTGAGTDISSTGAAPLTGSSTPGSSGDNDGNDNNGNANGKNGNANGNSGKGNGKGNQGNGKGNGGSSKGSAAPGPTLEATLQALLGKRKK